MIKIALKMLIILFTSMMIGTFLLMIVFSLPTDSIYDNVEKSAPVFKIEGTYPVMDDDYAKALDNWTDVLMLENAFYNKEDATLLEKVYMVYRPDSADCIPTNALQSYVRGEEGLYISSYVRYWHGYLAFLKPLLLFTDYLGIRQINIIFQSLLIVGAALLMMKRKIGKFVIPFIIMIAFLRPEAVMYSLQYSSIFYIMMFFLLLQLLFHKRLEKDQRYLYFFLIIGIVTNYIDFLTYPLAALGIPLIMFMVLGTDKKLFERSKNTVIFSLCWSMGYFGMWIGKWLLSSAFLSVNAFSDALGQIKFRVSSQVAQGEFERMDAVRKNFAFGFNKGFVIVLLLIIIIGLCLSIYSKVKITAIIGQSIPYLFVALMPIIWYLVLSNHSYIHSIFTYRTLAVSVFAVSCMGMELWDFEKIKTRWKRKGSKK